MYIWCAVVVNHVIDCVADIVRVVSYRFAVSYLIFFLKKRKVACGAFSALQSVGRLYPFPQ